MNRILAGLAGEVQVARKKEAELTQSFQEMEGQLGDAAHSGVRLMQLQREADANRSIYETFLARYKQAMEQESLAMPDARLISQAVPPEDPDLSEQAAVPADRHRRRAGGRWGSRLCSGKTSTGGSVRPRRSKR